MFPDGVSPRPPIRPAQRSEIISPYKLGRTITSSRPGFWVSCGGNGEEGIREEGISEERKEGRKEDQAREKRKEKKV